MKGLNVKVEGTLKAIEDIQRWELEKLDKIKVENAKTAFAVERDAKRNVRVDQGDLRGSIHNRIDGFIAEVFTNKKHAPYEEFGTGKHVSIPPGLEDVALKFRGNNGGGFDELLENIKAWCKRKGIDEEAAYPIALKIAREGREGQAFLFPAYERNKDKYKKAIAKILKS